jgi:hypothetical protein
VASDAEDLLAKQMDLVGIRYEREVRFAPPRRWRLDFQLDPVRRTQMGVEVDGGSWSGGHRRGKEADKECEKLNELALRRWIVLHFTPNQVESGVALKTIEEALGR